ncbi:MAG: penicillin-binding protein 2 [Proteobacteria bacterium]|nr:penicillin-binding protein 2 [Pseudomonadota bacterium]
MRHKHIALDGTIKLQLEVSRNRLIFVGVVVLLCYTALVIRLFDIGLDGSEGNRELSVPGIARLELMRGEIRDRNGVMLSTNLITSSLYANPKEILDPKEAADSLHDLFPSIPYDELLEKLSSGKTFVWIKRKLPPKEQYAVNNLGLPGLYFKREEKRIYPHAELVSHIMGVVGTDGHGLSGVEKQFDTQLLSGRTSFEPVNLSIDVRVQDVLRSEIASAIHQFRAIGGAGLVMDAHTGEVLGMVSLPDFDPNNPARIAPDATFNRASFGVYEMGSSFKTFTLAQALDQGITQLSDSYDATKPLVFAKHTIRDFHPEGKWLTVPEIFVHSSNIGTARIAMNIGEQRQKEFLQKIGLLDPAVLEIPERGTPMYPSHWRKINSMTIAFGHGIAVTPLHLVSAISAMINGGVYHTPTLLKRSQESFEKDPGKQVIKPATSRIMQKLFRLVVTKGTGEKADVPGYLVGGKTGTAEKLINGHYNPDARMSSFVGAFPMNNPKYVVFVMIDEPKPTKETFGYATGGWTAAPAVSHIIARIAPMLGVAPVNVPEEPKQQMAAKKIEDDVTQHVLEDN